MVIAVLRFLAVQILYGIFILTSYVVFPLLYPFGKWILKYKIPLLYIYFDREDGIWGSPSWRAQRGHVLGSGQKLSIGIYLPKWLNEFRIAVLWAWRNPAWNFTYVFRPKVGVGTVVKFYGVTYKYGVEWSVWDMCNIKTEDLDGKYAANFGPVFSHRYSIIGKMFLIYKIDGTTYFRYSKVWQGKKSGKWYELQLGTNPFRYVVKFRIMDLG